jgi:hypothetical protein
VELLLRKTGSDLPLMLLTGTLCHQVSYFLFPTTRDWNKWHLTWWQPIHRLHMISMESWRCIEILSLRIWVLRERSSGIINQHSHFESNMASVYSNTNVHFLWHAGILLEIFLFCVWYWGLNSELHTCEVAFYCLSHPFSPFCSGYFGDGVSLFA